LNYSLTLFFSSLLFRIKTFSTFLWIYFFFLSHNNVSENKAQEKMVQALLGIVRELLSIAQTVSWHLIFLRERAFSNMHSPTRTRVLQSVI